MSVYTISRASLAFALGIALSGAASQAWAAAPVVGGDGAKVYEQRCAQCHNGQVARAPKFEFLKVRSPESIVDSLENGVMKFIGLDSVEMEAGGCEITDSRGRKFLDCLGGYGTMSVGYAHPRVVAAVQDQVAKQAFSCRILFKEQTAKLAKKLAEISPGDLQFSFFCNSGTEAAEAAIKIARKKTGRTRLLSTEGGYHGKTMGALSVSGRDK